MACKLFELNGLSSKWRKEYLKNEMRLLMQLNHNNIIKAYDAIQTRYKAYIFMKLAENGCLDTYLKTKGRLDEVATRRMFMGLMSALDYMHGNNIAHRDLKLDNFLLDETLKPMIADFSFAVTSSVVKNKNKPTDKLALIELYRETVCGTTLYLAPEIHRLDNNKYTKYDAKRSDIWAMGVCLFEMLHGHKPFEGDYLVKSKELIDRQLRRDYKIDPDWVTSKSCVDLINAMLTPYYKLRPSSSSVMRNKWFRTKTPQLNQNETNSKSNN